MADFGPVPNCEGPRLHPYNPNGTPEIESIDEIGKGAHAHVFKVEIDGKTFALKVFMNQLVDADWVTPHTEEFDNVDTELLTAQWHPFNAECRAYARLKEAEKEHLVVRYHGYTALTPSQERKLDDRFGIQTWWSDDYEIEQSDPQYDQGLLRAIIKDFIQDYQPFGPKDAPKMIRDLKQLYHCGIVVHDLKEDAYLGGKLVDLSKAITVPHMVFDTLLGTDLDYTARYEVLTDLSLLNGMFNDWTEGHEDGPSIVCRPLPDGKACERLRSGKKITRDVMNTCLNPREIDWRTFRRRSRSAVPTNARTAVSKFTGRESHEVTKRFSRRNVSQSRRGKSLK